MDKIKRNERLGAMTRILTDTANRIHTLGEFCEMFGAAKSTISEDIDLVSASFRQFDLGLIETVAGAAGGVRYRAMPSMDRCRRVLGALAKRLQDNNADAVVVEGMEAGGHIGVLTTMALMTQVIPEVEIPVVMAGGIADGRGIAAALLMGAAGVQIGTRFLIAEECPVHENMKQKLIEAVDTDTIVTGQTIKSAVRGVKNKFSTEYQALEFSGKADKETLLKMATGTNKLAAVDGDVENGMS